MATLAASLAVLAVLAYAGEPPSPQPCGPGCGRDTVLRSRAAPFLEPQHLQTNTEEKIRQLLEAKSEEYAEFFYNDTLTLGKGDDIVATRFRDPSSPAVGFPMCSTVPQLLFPESGVDHSGREYRIVNVDKWRQGVVLEKCRRPRKACAPEYVNGTSCRQKFTYRNLLVVIAVEAAPGGSPARNTAIKLAKRLIRVPSACVCTRRRARRAL